MRDGPQENKKIRPLWTTLLPANQLFCKCRELLSCPSHSKSNPVNDSSLSPRDDAAGRGCRTAATAGRTGGASAGRGHPRRVAAPAVWAVGSNTAARTARGVFVESPSPLSATRKHGTPTPKSPVGPGNTAGWPGSFTCSERGRSGSETGTKCLGMAGRRGRNPGPRTVSPEMAWGGIDMPQSLRGLGGG